ncbi:MATE family efflux transporter [Phaeodactylibacter sp.]|jgi:MATE family multidrug resistance protein|uniref:MATE family efflux transporter n=1 Tax=Phaeodactylibacter sp. TaxID=1940289 RepID=UPI0025FE74C4|nr:MATE family efflux transporter [Phaeodactylibacter sp.]MCI4647881.1 MATE family efflux transporter [Phaeodactylibacter sp.]MCI5093122.1 MATE family efflux transporter [Phaeodactylibacter sp.]
MNREILRLAIPNIISNISVPLLSSVDTALMGRMSELHIGAVGIGAMLFNFIYWNFGFLRMGTTGLTAQAYGQQSDEAVAHTLGRALLVVFGVATLLLLLQWPLGEAGIQLMNTEDRQAGLVRQYFFIRIWAAPATLGLYALMGWFFGLQNAIFPLVLTIIINVANILLSVYLVEYRGMGVAGVAYGTLIAQYIGLIAAFGLAFYRYGHLLGHFQLRAISQWEKLLGFLRVNADIFIRTLCLTGVFGFFYSQSSGQGEMVLAVNTILLQYLNWMSYGVDGFAYASESLVGKYKGAADNPKTRRAIGLSFAWGMGLAALFSLGYGLGGNALLRLFTNQADVILAAQPFLFWMVLFPLLGTPSYIWDGVYIGLTASKSMRNSMLLAFVTFLLAYTIARGYGNHGLWLAMLVFLVARGGFQHWLYHRKGLALN